MNISMFYQLLDATRRMTLVIFFSIVSANTALGLDCFQKPSAGGPTTFYSKFVETNLRYNSHNKTKIKLYYTVMPRFCSENQVEVIQNQEKTDYIVLIPGGPLANQYFTNSELVKKLREHFNIILPEYRNPGDLTGQSQYQDSGIYNTFALASDLELIRNAVLGEKSWHMLGHSYGAYLALYYNYLYPEKVNTLVLANGFHNYRPFGDQLIDSINKSYRSRISRYFNSDTDQKKEFFKLYDQLVEKSRNGHLTLNQTSKSGSNVSVYKVPAEAFEFPVTLLIESYGMERTISAFKGWIDGVPSSISWLAQNFYQMSSSAQTSLSAFNCGEAIPQIEKYDLLDENNRLKIPRLKIIADCKNFRGQIRDSLIPLDRVTQPTLIISSEKDIIISSVYQLETHREIPQSQIEMIPNAGHFPFNRSEIASDKVVNFLLNHAQIK